MGAKLTGDKRGKFVATYLEKGYSLTDCASVVGISYGQMWRWWKNNKHKYLKPSNENSPPRVKSKRARERTQREDLPTPPSPDPLPEVELVLEEEGPLYDLSPESREMRLHRMVETLLDVSQGNLTPNEYAAISRELRYWREHISKFGSLTEEKETVKLDPADTEYILSQVEEVFCHACPFYQNALTTAAREQEKKRLLPTESP